MTPLERPQEFAGKEFLTDEELAEVRKKDESYIDFASNGGKGNSTGSYNKWWFEPGPSSRRTSLIVDPHDGRFPPLTSQG
jgi:hypothetical protein